MSIRDIRDQVRNNPGKAFSVADGGELENTAYIPEEKPESAMRSFTITSTVKLEATDTRAAILKASQLLASAANGTFYEFEELSVKVE